ncbi:MAG TPA: hypothetical protein VIH99_04800 [Bdellovibrionota bacterium]|jgi:hypothetical protein
MKTLMLSLIVGSLYASAHTAHEPHPMRHGFILHRDGKAASHLVADGHHSRQTEVQGRLLFDSTNDELNYLVQRQRDDKNKESYFVMLAQGVDLPAVKAGDILEGPIAEMHLGAFEPKNELIKHAKFEVQEVILNVENPFFKEEQP